MLGLQKWLKPPRHPLLRKTNFLVMRGIFIVPSLLICLWINLASDLVGEFKLDVRSKSFFSEQDFKRIPEFFTGLEFSGSKVYCRTNLGDREGFYFVVKVRGNIPKLTKGSHWLVNWVTSIDPAVQQVKIPVSDKNFSGKEVFIGLTGSDWLDSSVKPLAWSLCLVDANEQKIAQAQSFLWSK
jgi:hypothetical protein